MEEEFFLVVCVRLEKGDVVQLGYRPIEVTFGDDGHVTQVELHGERITVTAAEALRAIQRQGWRFLVYRGERLVGVEVKERDGRFFLRTERDDTPANNLDNLPVC